MKLAERRDDGLGAEPELGRAARMPGRPRVRNHLQVGNGRDRGVEQGEHFGLGVKRVKGLRLAGLPAARLPFAGEHQRERRMLIVAEIAASDLEQPDRRCATVEVAPGRGDQSRQQRRPHHLHVLADRVGQAPVAAAKGFGLVLRNEAPGDCFVEPASRGGAADAAFEQLRAGSRRLGDTRRGL